MIHGFGGAVGVKICFDTSVLVAAMVVQHPQHDRALRCYFGALEESIKA